MERKKIGDMKKIVHGWVQKEIRDLPGFLGALFHGSINDLDDHDTLPQGSDVDVLLVFDGKPPITLGKIEVDNVLIDASYILSQELQSPAQVLSRYHLAPSFAAQGIICDPAERLGWLHRDVRRQYAEERWVRRRVGDAQARALRHLNNFNGNDPWHDQVMSWYFGAGVMTHMLLVAGLKNPTVRRRYAAVRDLLAEYGLSHVHEYLLTFIGCHDMDASRALNHWQSLQHVFQATRHALASAKQIPPFPFMSDLSEHARLVALDGSKILINQGDHREAMFWVVVTYSRCLKVLAAIEPKIEASFYPHYRQMLRHVHAGSKEDLKARIKRVRESLPNIKQLAQTIIDANPHVRKASKGR